jgi:ATP-dependent exoDNAse (exonuclease V) alpha subunit
MVGTLQMQRITEQLQIRGCKLVLVGDPAQLQPIEAGTPFKEIIGQNGAARLSEIRRQKTGWQRQASSDLANGNIQMALRNYADHGAVHEAESRDYAITNLVDDYIADWKKHGSSRTRIALAHRRKDVHAINQTIRAAMREQGKNAEEALFDTEHGPRAFAAGDRLLFTRNYHNLGVKNGMLATVEHITDDQISVILDNETGNDSKTVLFSPSDFSAFDHGYAVTIHRAQGCTIDRSFVLSSKTMDSHLSYVALTRHKSEVRIYTAPEIKIKQETMQFNGRYRLSLRRR